MLIQQLCFNREDQLTFCFNITISTTTTWWSISSKELRTGGPYVYENWEDYIFEYKDNV